MEIIGYSERGAMNALFYGIALKNDENAMKAFLNLACIENYEGYHDFKLYMEFSLSEFGSPDLVFTAKDKNEQKTVFFVEAKASCGKEYNKEVQFDHHNDYITEGKFDNGHASNLFFQLRLKNYFYNECCPEGDKKKKDELPMQIRESRGQDRKLGENPIVLKFKDELNKDLYNDKYIAIIPKQQEGKPRPDNLYGFKIHYVTWEEINEIFEKYVGKTIEFNQNEGGVSQILNNRLVK